MSLRQLLESDDYDDDFTDDKDDDKKDDDDYDKLIEEYKEVKEERDNGYLQPPEPHYNPKFKPSKRCIHGSRCNRRATCSFYHFESDTKYYETAYCKCTDMNCLFAHPNRVISKPNRVAPKRNEPERFHPYRSSHSSSSSSTNLICKKCGGSHVVTLCPLLKCNKCARFGHLASRCHEFE